MHVIIWSHVRRYLDPIVPVHGSYAHGDAWAHRHRLLNYAKEYILVVSPSKGPVRYRLDFVQVFSTWVDLWIFKDRLMGSIRLIARIRLATAKNKQDKQDRG